MSASDQAAAERLDVLEARVASLEDDVEVLRAMAPAGTFEESFRRFVARVRARQEREGA